MAFVAGTVEVICSNCGAPVSIQVSVESLLVQPGVDKGADSRDGKVTVFFNQYGNSTSHICRKVR